MRLVPRFLALLLAASMAACMGIGGSSSADSGSFADALATREFGALVDSLSEPGGFFQSDNLVGNETSYLHVLGTLDALGVSGGVYLGVGPDQNFSYIAQVRPELVFLIDIRRDAMLQHLLYKALFEMSRNRLEFLCLLTGAPAPRDLRRWDPAGIEEIIDYIDHQNLDADIFQRTVDRVRERVARNGVTLSEDDLAQIQRIHTAFADWGLDIRYAARAANLEPGRPLQTGGFGRRGLNSVVWRQLLLETDRSGVRRNYLAGEESFRFVRDLHVRNRIVPVVGNLAGAHALASIGREVRARGLRISAFYTSNVEQYLMQGPGFARFARTVAALPFDDRSVIIRSYLRGSHPYQVSGHRATQIAERFADFAATMRAGGYVDYWDLVTRNAIAGIQ